MRALMVAVVGMGVLIVAGTATLLALLISRHPDAPLAAASTTLSEAIGTHIVTVTALGPDRLALQLQGGGPDRVLIYDLHAGRTAGEIMLPAR